MEFNLVSLLENNLERVLKWVSVVDAKAKFTLSILLIVLGYSISQVSQLVNLLGKIPKEEIKWVGIALTIVLSGTFFCLLISFINLVSIIYPKRDPSTGRDSVFFFESIAEMSATEFNEKLTSMTIGQLANELNDQTYNSAKVVKKKFDQLSNSIKWFYVSLSLLIIFLITQQILQALL